jgi:enoyl-CoA hydratase
VIPSVVATLVDGPLRLCAGVSPFVGGAPPVAYSDRGECMDRAQRDGGFFTRREGSAIVLTFDGPRTRNALSLESHVRLEKFLYDVSADSSVSSLILTGEGSTFCSGADLKRYASEVEPFLRDGDISSLYLHAQRLLENLLNVRQPTIAAVNGDAVGIGATLAFGCDLVVASDKARFSDAHVSAMGVPAGDGGTVLWPLMMGVHRAKEALLLGEWVHAKDAFHFGIINHCVPDDEVMPLALRMADRIASLPAEAVRWTKMSINNLLRSRMTSVLNPALAAEMHAMHSSTESARDTS